MEFEVLPYSVGISQRIIGTLSALHKGSPLMSRHTCGHFLCISTKAACLFLFRLKINKKCNSKIANTLKNLVPVMLYPTIQLEPSYNW
jgi:hypothetical protein